MQSAWEVLGDAAARAAYDRDLRRPARGADSAAEAEDEAPRYGRGAGFASPAFRTNAAGSTSSTRRGTGESAARPSGTAHLAPVYIPDLSRPEPLSLPLTSQRTHGGFGSRGIFGGSRALRRAEHTAVLLEKHVLADLPTARLFNTVALEPARRDRRGQARTPRGRAADHVLVCGDTLVVVSSLDVHAATVSWDGRHLHAAGRSVAVPDLAGQSRALRAVLEAAMRETGRETSLSVGQQIVLHSPDGSMQSPVVEARGTASGTVREPLAPARAFRSIREQLAASPQANVIDRHLLAALRDQLQHPLG